MSGPFATPQQLQDWMALYRDTSGRPTIYAGNSMNIPAASGYSILFGDNNTMASPGSGSIIAVQGAGDTVHAGDASLLTAFGDGGGVYSVGTNSQLEVVGGGGDFISAVRGSAASLQWADGGGNTLILGGAVVPNVPLGTANNTVYLSGLGHETIQDYGHGDVMHFAGAGTTSVNLNTGSHGETIYADGGGLTGIHDLTGGGDHFTLEIGAAGGRNVLFGADPASVLFELSSKLLPPGTTDPSTLLTSDGHGGSLLTFASHLGSLDVVGIATSQLHSGNFAVV